MNSTEKDSIYYLEKAPVPRAIIHMAVPMIMGMILGLVYNIIDAYFIGRLGNTAMMAAITLAFPIEILVMGVGQIYGSGGGTLIPRLLGDKNFEEVKKASSVNFYLALLSGIVLMLALVPCLTPLSSPDGRDRRCIAVYQRLCPDISPGKSADHYQYGAFRDDSRRGGCDSIHDRDDPECRGQYPAGSHLHLCLEDECHGSCPGDRDCQWGGGGLLRLVHPGEEQGAKYPYQRFPPKQGNSFQHLQDRYPPHSCSQP